MPRQESGQQTLRPDLEVILDRAPGTPRVGIVLGSGLGSFADMLQDAVSISYADLPGFPHSTVSGHKGCFVRGTCGEVEVVAQQGRFHLYEGYSGFEVSHPIRVMKALGTRVLIVTNAAGGLHGHWEPGTLMVIEDHINFQFRSPLTGRGDWVDDSRFVDLASPYSKELMAIAQEEARVLGIPLRVGTYFGNLGPTYETPAEVHMIRRLGGDAVGMSTTQEVIAAKHSGMEVLGISCIANPAAGLGLQKLSHQDVLEVTRRMGDSFAQLLLKIVPRIT